MSHTPSRAWLTLGLLGALAWRVMPVAAAPAEEAPAAVTLELSTSETRYRAQWDDSKRLVRPTIPLRLTLRNASAESLAWEAPCQLTLEARARQSGWYRRRTFDLCETEGNSPQLWAGETLTYALEVGRWLTSVAAGGMKGDRLIVQGQLRLINMYGRTTHVIAEPIEIGVFVPE